MLPSVVDFLGECGIDRTGVERCRRLEQHLVAIRTENPDTNLTRLTGTEEYWVKHVADSLAVVRAAPALLRGDLTVADVGSGAGFPAVPLACLNPTLAVTAIEARGRKADFVRRVAAEIGLDNLFVINRQVREAAAVCGGGFDLVLLRAVGAPARYVRQTRQLLRPVTGRLIFYMTPSQWAEERLAAAREAAKYRLTVTPSAAFELPAGAGRRLFAVFAAADG